MRTRPDVFALANTGLDVFLRAEVGTEPNGSPLTMLSLLARSGFDPWAEAARWARLPRAATIDRLAGLIVQMPLCPKSLFDARGTAARLADLLPGQVQMPVSDEARMSLPAIAIIAGICAVLTLAFIAGNVVTRGDQHFSSPAHQSAPQQ
jgi:hypothetical protein